MKTITFVHKDVDQLQRAEDWLVSNGFRFEPGWEVRSSRVSGGMNAYPNTLKKIVRYHHGRANAYTHALAPVNAHYTLSAFKQAILEDMETTNKTKEGKKVDYKDICIEFDTDEQAQAFAEAVHKNGHPIVFWEKSYIGAVISFSEWRKGLARDRGAHTNKTLKAHISEAPAEWLRFLLSPVKPALKVAGYDVKITAEDAKIGCTTVTWEEVKSVYEAMKEVRS